MAGRAAERLIFDELSTGAADDLAKATEIARSMVTRYGMDERLGHATYEVERSRFLGAPPVTESVVLSDETIQAIDEAVREILNGAFERALELLRARRSVLEEGARTLLAHETLERKDLEQLKGRVPA
jgi:cell division protease FtsH